MSIENIFENITVGMFNTFQDCIKEKIIPEMIKSFNNNGYEIDKESFEQFFEDVEDYKEIAKYISVKDSTPKIIKTIKKENVLIGPKTELKKTPSNKDKKQTTIPEILNKNSYSEKENKPDIKQLLEKIKASKMNQNGLTKSYNKYGSDDELPETAIAQNEEDDDNENI